MRHATTTKDSVNVRPSLTPANPALLYQKDLQAFATVREYLQALRTKQEAKVKAIYTANVDLQSYFVYVAGQFIKNPYYEV